MAQRWRRWWWLAVLLVLAVLVLLLVLLPGGPLSCGTAQTWSLRRGCWPHPAAY